MIAQFNQRTFRTAEVVSELATWDWIEGGEARFLGQIQNEIRCGKILEIGVGAGRMVPRLSSAAKSYIGIDYSPEMVDICRKRFPSVPFLCADARNLSQFQNESFALVVFSFNGIDYMSNSERLQVLGEVWRVLAAGGFFLFSSHNLESPLYRRQSPGVAESSPQYAIVREKTHNFLYLCYYATRVEVRRQLLAAGFKKTIECCDRDGMKPANDLRSGWLHYLARK